MPYSNKYTLFIKEFTLESRIGVYSHEQEAPQQVLIDLLITFNRPEQASDTLSTTLCYHQAINYLESLSTLPHQQLLETLGENIIAHFFTYPEVHAIKVQLHKPHLFPEAAAVGILIEASR